MKIISRKEARLKGELYYFTGKPCKHNHVSKRIVRNATCYECTKVAIQNWREKDSSKLFYKEREANPRYKKSRSEYRKRNSSKRNSYRAKRRASKIQRTPVWSETKEIKEFYANCPEGYQVDHIIPLQGKLVSGLHVLGNLQYLTINENCSKGNQYEIK